MSHQPNLRLIDEDALLGRAADEFDAPPPPRAAPQMFTRVLTVPAGAPWDQARAAQLEARMGAPLPLTEVVYRLRRLEPWRPGRAGRYGAFYLRSADVGDGFSGEAPLDGQVVRVAFLSRVEQVRRARKGLILVLGAGLMLALMAGAVATAMKVRERAEEDLVRVEQAAAMRARSAAETAAAKAQARALDAEGLRGQDLDALLSRMAWASSALTPGTRVDGLHWDHGYLGLEVRGDAAPFQRLDRPVQKSERPVRAGVWLWGVPPDAPGTGSGGEP